MGHSVKQFLLSISLFFILTGTAFSAPNYTISHLGNFLGGGGTGHAFDINNNGQVVAAITTKKKSYLVNVLLNC